METDEKRFVCKRCTKAFLQKSKLLEHLYRKVPCKPMSPENDINPDALIVEANAINDKKKAFECLCGKAYAARESLSRHKASCKKEMINSDLHTSKEVDDLRNELQDMKKQNEKLVKELTESRHDVEELYDRLRNESKRHIREIDELKSRYVSMMH